jgi:glycosyltransferase involved in cell wall biosynthesis
MNMAAWRNLSVFFPVLNEAAALPGVLDGALEVLENMDLEAFEIIVVDDGSTDTTAAIAADYARRKSQVRVVRHKQNLGYGAALTSGFEAAKYDWVVYNDGDGQFNLNDLKRFAEPSQKADVVLGYRESRHDHWGRKLNAWLWGLAVWAIIGLKVRDLDCGFKLFRTERVRKLGRLQAKGAVISAELLLRLKEAGCNWEQVGVRHFARRGGTPTGAKLDVIWRALLELWALRKRRALPPAL